MIERERETERQRDRGRDIETKIEKEKDEGNLEKIRQFKRQAAKGKQRVKEKLKGKEEMV